MTQGADDFIRRPSHGELPVAASIPVTLSGQEIGFLEDAVALGDFPDVNSAVRIAIQEMMERTLERKVLGGKGLVAHNRYLGKKAE